MRCATDRIEAKATSSPERGAKTTAAWVGRLAFWPAIWLLALWTMGVAICCSLDQAAEMSVPNCQVTGCPDEQTCLSNGFCGPVAQTVTLALRVQPDAQSGLLEQHFTDLVMTPDMDPIDITLHQPTSVQGRIYINAEQPVPVTGARVLFRLKGGMPNLPLTRETTTDAVSGEYQIELVPGTYQVTILIDDAAFPPFREGELTVSGGIFHWSISLTDPDSYYLIQGQLVRMRSGVLEEEAESPISGATVSLESVPGGTAVSTSALTDVAGHFSVRVPPGEREYAIRISPSEENKLIPNLTLEQVSIAESVDLGVILAGEWADPVQIGGIVNGLNGIATPVAGATFFLRSEMESGTFSRIALTGTDGSFSEQIIPGDYQITVVPPAIVDWAATTFQQSWHQSQLDQQFDLAQKPVLQGVVTGPDGLGLAGITMSATPIGYPVSSLSLNPVQDETDSNGLFQLRVHPGRQLILAIPASNSCMSPVVEDSIEVSQSGVQLSIQLQEYGCITGRILAPSGDPLSESQVELFLERDGSWLQFAERTTDAQGLFSLGLPVVGLQR
ncbi:MAG: carboxypeptidase regulatory-like domain-containing protein [Bradymonadales bacterium]|nr:carboxypeptidase regulatory-like domain-containing protein [Bradymonadales bacterium]